MYLTFFHVLNDFSVGLPNLGLSFPELHTKHFIWTYGVIYGQSISAWSRWPQNLLRGWKHELTMMKCITKILCTH